MPDIIIKDVPEQCVARIKHIAMRIIADMERPKVTEEKQAEYEAKIKSIKEANGLTEEI